MTTSKRLAERKVDKFEKNVVRRGSTKKASQYECAHIVLGVFAFIIVASFLFPHNAFLFQSLKEHRRFKAKYLPDDQGSNK